MAPKVKKEASDNKGNDLDPELWPDLPQQLIKIISWQPTLMQNIGDGGVTKVWRSPSRQCNNNPTSKPPIWLELHGDGNHSNRMFKLNLNIKFHSGEWYWYSNRPQPDIWERYVGYTKASSSPPSPAMYYLYHPVDWGSQYYLPRWDTMVPFRRLVVSTCPKNYLINMVITGISHPAFAFGRYNTERGYEWIKQDCNIPDVPHFSSQKQSFMRFTNAIGHKGKFYALSLQGTLAVIEPGTDSSDLKITALGPKRAVPRKSSSHFREYLMESNGEILLVFLIFITKPSGLIVDDVEAFKLDTGKLTWIKMDRIGDRTLFLGTNCCMSVSASEMGSCKSDCVFFSNKSRRAGKEGWWVYEFEGGCISRCSRDAIQLPEICRTVGRPYYDGTKPLYLCFKKRVPPRVFL